MLRDFFRNHSQTAVASWRGSIPVVVPACVRLRHLLVLGSSYLRDVADVPLFVRATLICYVGVCEAGEAEDFGKERVGRTPILLPWVLAWMGSGRGDSSFFTFIQVLSRQSGASGLLLHDDLQRKGGRAWCKWELCFAIAVLKLGLVPFV